MPLNHPWTCSFIDRDISEFNDLLFDTLKHHTELLQEKAEELGLDLEKGFLNDKELLECVEEHYRDFEHIFENLRNHNEELRSSAESQIEDLEDEVSDLETRIFELESTLAEYEQ